MDQGLGKIMILENWIGKQSHEFPIYSLCFCYNYLILRSKKGWPETKISVAILAQDIELLYFCMLIVIC